MRVVPLCKYSQIILQNLISCFCLFQIPPEPVKRRSAVKKLSKDVIPGNAAEHDNMGQGQTTPEYIDIFDTEPRRLSQKHKEDWERANSISDEAVTMRHNDSLRRGHQNEESSDYCYAYSGSISREGEDEVDAAEPMKVSFNP